jgi:hypothetical protein
MPPAIKQALCALCAPLQAYMWCEAGPVPSSLPAVIAQPWAAVSRALDMPPVLVYATYNLLNWRRWGAGWRRCWGGARVLRGLCIAGAAECAGLCWGAAGLC